MLPEEGSREVRLGGHGGIGLFLVLREIADELVDNGDVIGAGKADHGCLTTADENEYFRRSR
ncbi:hypothetical protein Nans01_10690 [Nocardiopsis ansamitocini]|uniref:Uncharacterized protein n=1 Tax=Nocardiopsis ansamitocini TaxID=1670832 RepID=A0A9W6P480_9ACTN|nr:hypothetical protein Nans01_10690 [Nocardiopsis ansamitocini]